MEKEWKQFVQNRMLEIRELVPAASWRHCHGSQNPADIPSSGVSPAELQEKIELYGVVAAWPNCTVVIRGCHGSN